MEREGWGVRFKLVGRVEEHGVKKEDGERGEGKERRCNDGGRVTLVLLRRKERRKGKG